MKNFTIIFTDIKSHITKFNIDVQAGFRKGRGTRDQIAIIHWIIEKAREFQKNIYFCFIDYTKAFVWIPEWSSGFCYFLQSKS